MIFFPFNIPLREYFFGAYNVYSIFLPFSLSQSGLSRELFEQWCTDRRNGVIIAGYCVEGTLAKVKAC